MVLLQCREGGSQVEAYQSSQILCHGTRQLHVWGCREGWKKACPLASRAQGDQQGLQNEHAVMPRMAGAHRGGGGPLGHCQACCPLDSRHPQETQASRSLMRHLLCLISPRLSLTCLTPPPLEPTWRRRCAQAAGTCCGPKQRHNCAASTAIQHASWVKCLAMLQAKMGRCRYG
jgi:hypothetical protein